MSFLIFIVYLFWPIIKSSACSRRTAEIGSRHSCMMKIALFCLQLWVFRPFLSQPTRRTFHPPWHQKFSWLVRALWTCSVYAESASTQRFASSTPFQNLSCCTWKQTCKERQMLTDEDRCCAWRSLSAKTRGALTGMDLWRKSWGMLEGFYFSAV